MLWSFLTFTFLLQAKGEVGAGKKDKAMRIPSLVRLLRKTSIFLLVKEEEPDCHC